jgi:hypothetical protein
MTDEATSLPLSQEQETQTQYVARTRFVYRYAYARSADSRTANESGQDYLLIREDAQRLVFALCDGVSQSFMGDIAARLLGNALVDWLWKHPDLRDVTLLQQELDQFLYALTDSASEQVMAFRLPEDLSPLVRDVLEQKRALGSESTFVAGQLNIVAEQWTLVWMGDSRIRLWSTEGAEHTACLGDTFHTGERWSSSRGPVGQVHAFTDPIQNITNIAVYSDGFSLLDQYANLKFKSNKLDELIGLAGDAPTSDDITFLEIKLRDVTQTKQSVIPISPVQFEVHCDTSKGAEIPQTADDMDQDVSWTRKSSSQSITPDYFEQQTSTRKEDPYVSVETTDSSPLSRYANVPGHILRVLMPETQVRSIPPDLLVILGIVAVAIVILIGVVTVVLIAR